MLRHQFGVSPVIVISETRKHAKPPAKLAKDLRYGRNKFRFVRDVIARKYDEIRLELTRDRYRTCDVLETGKRAVMDVRKMQDSELGTIIDPIADKLLMTAAFIILTLPNVLPPTRHLPIPFWVTASVIGRDVLIITGYGIIVFLTDERPEVKPSLIGKFSTLLQLVTLGVALALLHDPKLMTHWLRDLFIGSTAVATVLSGVQYIYRGFLWLQNKAPSISRIS